MEDIMENENTFMTVSRGENSQINIYIKKNTYGYEIYKTMIMLLDKLIFLNYQGEPTEEDINKFFAKIRKDYDIFVEFHKKELGDNSE